MTGRGHARCPFLTLSFQLEGILLSLETHLASLVDFGHRVLNESSVGFSMLQTARLPPPGLHPLPAWSPPALKTRNRLGRARIGIFQVF